MICNMVTSLFDKERITTTAAKAKETRRFAERLITRAKKGYAAHQEVQDLRDAGKTDEAQRKEAFALAQWRLAGRFVRKKQILKKLFEEIAPQYLERNGGYTRILNTGVRLGDNASTVMLELVGTEVTSKPKPKKPRKREVEEEVEETAEATEAAEETEGKKARKRKAKGKAEEPPAEEAPESEEAAEAAPEEDKASDA